MIFYSTFLLRKKWEIIYSVQTMRTDNFPLYPIQLENPFEVIKKTKKMSKLLDNDYFRDLLQQADEELMVCTSIHYLPYHLKEQSMANNEKFFHLFICDNYPEFNLSDTESEDKESIWTCIWPILL